MIGRLGFKNVCVNMGKSRTESGWSSAGGMSCEVNLTLRGQPAVLTDCNVNRSPSYVLGKYALK